MNQPPAYSCRLDRALALTVDAFRHIRRKCTPVPYLTHLLAVTALVGEHGGDEDMLIAALLHDYLEDIPTGSAEALREAFGERVADLVLRLSDTVEHPKPPWKERKLRYIDHLRHEASDVKLISAADKLHNCRTLLRDHRQLGDVIFDRFRPSMHETLWYYRSVLEALRDGWEHPIVDELEEVVSALHAATGERM